VHCVSEVKGYWALWQVVQIATITL